MARSARLYRRTPGTHVFFSAIPNRVLGVTTTAPNQIWVGDITYLRSLQGWRYLSLAALAAELDIVRQRRAAHHYSLVGSLPSP